MIEYLALLVQVGFALCFLVGFFVGWRVGWQLRRMTHQNGKDR